MINFHSTHISQLNILRTLGLIISIITLKMLKLKESLILRDSDKLTPTGAFFIRHPVLINSYLDVELCTAWKIELKNELIKPYVYVISSTSSTIRLRPLGLFLHPGNHHPISLVFLYFIPLQVCNCT